MGGDNTARLGTALADLKAKRRGMAEAISKLQAEMRELDGDIAVIETHIENAGALLDKHGVMGTPTAVPTPFAPPSQAPAQPSQEPVTVAKPAESAGRPAQSERTKRALAHLEERYEERPARVGKDGKLRSNAKLPTSGPELEKLYEDNASVANEAAKQPTKRGGHNRYSSKGLLTGVPIVPDLLTILEVARKPMTAGDCTAALLKKRGIHYEGDKFIACVNRVLARLGSLRKKKRVQSERHSDRRQLVWALASKTAEQTTATPPASEPDTTEGKADLGKLFGLSSSKEATSATGDRAKAAPRPQSRRRS